MRIDRKKKRKNRRRIYRLTFLTLKQVHLRRFSCVCVNGFSVLSVSVSCAIVLAERKREHNPSETVPNVLLMTWRFTVALSSVPALTMLLSLGTTLKLAKTNSLCATMRTNKTHSIVFFNLKCLLCQASNVFFLSTLRMDDVRLCGCERVDKRGQSVSWA